jgi:hypothetical protein
LSNDSSGAYRCELSGDAPEFKLVHETSNMTVVGKSLFDILNFMACFNKQSAFYCHHHITKRAVGSLKFCLKNLLPTADNRVSFFGAMNNVLEVLCSQKQASFKDFKSISTPENNVKKRTACNKN